MTAAPAGGSAFEAAGVPDVADTEGGDLDSALPPAERPVAVTDFGTTVAEMRTGESLDGRLRRELPDSPEAGGATSDIEPEPDVVGRLASVDPADGAEGVVEDDVTGVDVGDDLGGLTAEEQAMHLVRDTPAP